MVFATLAFLGAFGADQGLLTYFADLSGPGLPYPFGNRHHRPGDVILFEFDGLQAKIA